MPFSCKQRVCKKSQWRDSEHRFIAMQRTIALSCHRIIASLHHRLSYHCDIVITPSSSHHCSNDPRFDGATVNCVTRISFIWDFCISQKYFEIYTYHSYIIYIFCTVTSHAVNTSMYKLSTAYLHKLKLSSIHIGIYLI